MKAITFSPKEPQSGLRTISIAGNSNYRVNPLKDDFFKRLIDLRSAIKAELKPIKKRLKTITRQLKNASSAEADGFKRERETLGAKEQPLDSDQQALKILANSTSYGIFVEMIVAELDAVEKLTCFGPGGEGFPVESKKIEEPGNIFTRCSRP